MEEGEMEVKVVEGAIADGGEGKDAKVECNKCSEIRKVAPIVKCQNCANYVNENGTYYKYNNEKQETTWITCNSCYKAARVKITLTHSGDGNNDNGAAGGPVPKPRTVRKAKFVKSMNEATEPEAIIKCVCCFRPFHTACVKWVTVEGWDEECYLPTFASVTRDYYYCDDCRDYLKDKLGFLSLQELAKAKDLSETPLSSFIEDRVNKMLPNEANYIFVRVLSCIDKTYKLATSLHTYLKNYYDVPEELQYRNRLLGCFQESDDGDSALFFTVYFQEYGPDCPETNRNSIYIGMLDSVQMLEPRSFRRRMYHCVFLSYLSYMKDLNFEHVYLWSCTPLTEEVEYVFQRRPATQRLLPATFLQDWYKKMMRIGKDMGIIVEFKTLYDLLPETEEEFFRRLPLFKDDRWPHEIADVVNKVQSGKLVVPRAIRNGKKQRNKNRNPGRQNVEASKNTYVFTLIQTLLREQTNNFLYMRLSAVVGNMVGNVDPIITSELMDCRKNLVNCFITYKLEFQDLRKTVFATKTTLMELLVENPSIICDSCSAHITSLGYTRLDCDNKSIDICMSCSSEGGTDFKEILPSFNKKTEVYKKIQMENLKFLDEFEKMLETDKSSILEMFAHLHNCDIKPCPTCLTILKSGTLLN